MGPVAAIWRRILSAMASQALVGLHDFFPVAQKMQALVAFIACVWGMHLSRLLAMQSLHLSCIIVN